MSSVEYLHLPANSVLPRIEKRPRKMVVLVEQDVSGDWQNTVSDWIVQSGCLYMMAWGLNCSAWDDSVDLANLEKFEFEEIPENEFIHTTWHENEPMSEVFWSCIHTAAHSSVDLSAVTILHIADEPRADEILRLFQDRRQ